MKRRYAVFAVTFVVSFLIGIQVVGVAEANPVPWLSTPNLEKPTLTIETPQNYTTYDVGNIPVNFTVSTPSSWSALYFGMISYVGQLDSVRVYLDGNQTHYGSNNFTLTQLEPGLHMLNVTVLSYTYYQGPIYSNSSILSPGVHSDRGPVYEYPIVVSDIVYFTVQHPEYSTSSLLSQTALTTLAIVIVIIAVASVLLVYFRRRKGKP